MPNQNSSNMEPMPSAPNMHTYPNIMEENVETYPKANMMPITENRKVNPAIYPEIYYKLMPFISAAGDYIKSTGIAYLTQQQLDDICDRILDDFTKMHPDMADYMKTNDIREEEDSPAEPVSLGFGGGFFPGGFGPFGDGFGFRDGFGFGCGPGFGPCGPFGRRGLARDLIGGLLLGGLFGGRGFFW